MTEQSTPVQVSLLTAGRTLPAWAAAAVRRMLSETDAELAVIIEDTSTDDRSALETVQRLIELREWGVVSAARELFAADPEPLERTPVTDLPGGTTADWVACEPITVDGWKSRLPESAVDRMAETDVAIRFGFGFLVGKALEAPQHGVLSFHHGDFREYRGQPMGFWEYVHGRETAGVTLQRINETLDGGEIVATAEVDITDAPTWGAVKCRLFEASEPMLAEGIQRLESSTTEPETLSADELGTLYTHPKGRPVLTYLRKTAVGLLSEYRQSQSTAGEKPVVRSNRDS